MVQSGDASLAYQYLYDQNGRLNRLYDPYGNLMQERSYTDLGRVAKITDALGGGISFTYDAAGRRITAKTAGGSSQGWEYDPWGQTPWEHRISIHMTRKETRLPIQTGTASPQA